MSTTIETDATDEVAIVGGHHAGFQCITSSRTLMFLDYTSLCQFSQVNRSIHDFLTQDKASGYWQAICNSFSVEKGLYSTADVFYSGGSRHFFFNTLFSAKDKWTEANTIVDGEEAASVSNIDKTQAFNIEVGCRFRPGDRMDRNLVVPLHQFLKVRRQKAVETNSFCVGEADPEEYLDPFLKTLMRDPVKLSTSDRILERSVAVQCILRGGKDPFNNRKLTMQDLIPMPELAVSIQEWRKKKNETDISLGTTEVKSLISDLVVDQDIVAALVEAEQISYAAKRAMVDASDRKRAHGDSDAEIDENIERPETDDGTVDENVNPNLANAIGTEGSLTSLKANMYNEAPQGFESKHWGENSARILEISKPKRTVTMNVPGSGVRPFYFSEVNDAESTQESVYKEGPRSLVSSFLNGYNVCLLCYGQTGSGKTFTMFGPDVNFTAEMKQSTGIVLRSCKELLMGRDTLSKIGISVTYTAQFVEIYNEKCTDLLSGNECSIRRDNGDLINASERSFRNDTEFLALLTEGQERKHFAATAMNDRSSRSHSVLVIHATQTCSKRGLLVKSRMHLVDLAGSERVKKSRVTGQNLKEAVGINQSLLVLGKVITALVECKSHVPYLESKLTTLLRSAFGGNSRTVAIINCRSDDVHGDETLQSLRFGERCGLISNSITTVASSAKDALNVLNETLERVSSQLSVLEAKNKTELPSYQKLKFSYQQLLRRKSELNLPVDTESTKSLKSVLKSRPPLSRYEPDTLSKTIVA